ncbi:MAG: efflux RND transporter permease subunit [Planctomycetes bacterium]|nr:efflux RND transporter permease subunit [Planctomycetota bacterium]MCW8138267.1 efflux RND transporter permease subunit [Planctomycetota bacterium]
MIDALIRGCIRKPFLVFVAVALMLGGGWYALTNIPVDAVPDIGEKQVIVYADWPGRSPQDVDDQVTYPLTIALEGTPGVKVIRSASGFGFSMVFVIFKDEIDYYWARSRVLERMNVARQWLPPGVEPVLGPDATALGWIFYYTLEGEGFDLGELRSIQDWFLRYQLQAVEGVSEVASIGGYVKQYQVDVDPVRLRAHRVTLDQVAEAVRRSNIDVGAKVIEINQVEFFIRGLGFIKSVRDLENVAVRAEGGTPLYVKDVAHVSLGPEFRRGALDKAGVEAVGGIVTMRYGENPLRVLERVKAKLKELSPGLPEKTLPDGRVSRAHVVPYYDRSDIVHETMDTLREALTQEAIVAGFIVLLFLLHVRSTLTILPTLPLAVGISFMCMYWLGVDSNLMSLAGIAIAIGDVADMGIIMTENIYRHVAMNDGRSYRQRVEDGATEVGTAILVAVSNTVVSFLPVFALVEQEGKMFKPLAYTKTFAIAASAVLAVTVVPVLCYYLFQTVTWSRRRCLTIAAVGGLMAMLGLGLAGRAYLFADAPPLQGWLIAVVAGLGTAGVIYRATRERLLPLEENVVARGILRVYTPALRWVLIHKKLFLSAPLALILIGLMIWLGWSTVAMRGPLERVGLEPGSWGWWQRMERTFPGLGREFLPPLDEGSLLYMPSLVPAGSLTAALEVVQRQDAAIRTVPEVQHVVGKLGRAETALDPAPVGMIETLVMLKPPEQWRRVREERFYSGWPGWLRWPLRRAFPEERPITKQEILDELRRKVDIPGVLPTWLQPIQTRLVMLQSGFRAMMGVKVFGADLREIERIGLQMEALLNQVPGATDVVADRLTGKPYVEVHIDRERIARYGANIRDVQDVIEIAIGGDNLSRSVEGRERYPIRVRYQRELRDNLEELERVLVPTASGGHVPLNQVADIRYTIGPQEIKSENTLLVGYVTLNTRDRDEVSVVEDAERLLRSKIDSGELVLPKGYYYTWAGQFESQVRSTRRLALLVPLCLLLDFVLLYLGFGRWWVAILVFLGVIVSAAGGFLLVYLLSVNLSVAVWVGFIALFGVAEDNGVLMGTYLNDLFTQRTPHSIDEVREIVVEAGEKRVRPALMTIVTTVIGLLPIFLTTGRGSDVMQPMALPSVGGMAVSVITLFIVPCIYCWVEEAKLRRRLAAGPLPDALAPEAPLTAPTSPPPPTEGGLS